MSGLRRAGATSFQLPDNTYVKTTILPPALFSCMQRCASANLTQDQTGQVVYVGLAAARKT